MSSEWTTSSLLNHYEVRSGLSKPAKDFGSGYPFLTFKDVFYNYFTPESLGDLVQSTQKEREGCSVLRGDVFLTRTSETMHELGMSCVALRDYKDATFNGFCKRLRPKPESDLLPEYVGYYLRSPRFRQAMLAMSTMSTRASLNNEMIGRLVISFPSRKSQAQISEVLKSLDDRITVLRETNATLEAIAQALFKSWFVDFDPVRAKMAGRAPEGMDEATAALFPDALEETELGLVPQGWRVMPFLEACDLQGGAQPPASTFVDTPREGYVRLLQIRDFSTDAHKTYIPDTTKLKRATEDDVLLGRYGSASGDKAKDSLGRVCRGLSGAYNVALMKLVPIHVGREFALQLVNDPRFYNYLQGVSSKAVQSGFSKSELGQYKVVVPSQELCEVFEDIGLAFWERLKHGVARQREMADLRDALLPRLISGQLRTTEGIEATKDAMA